MEFGPDAGEKASYGAIISLKDYPVRTVAGMLDGVQYLASGLTGFLLGHFLDKWGWGVWTWMLMPFSAVGAVLMVRLWNETPMRGRAPQPAAAKV